MDGEGVDLASQLRWLAGILVAGAIVIALLIASDGEEVQESERLSRAERIQRMQDQYLAEQRSSPDCPPPAPSWQRGFPDPAPAAIREHVGPSIPIADRVNGWIVRSGFLSRRVWAGAVDPAGTTGALVITDYRPCASVRRGEKTVLLEFEGTGALRIVSAPEGEGVSGDMGELRFDTAHAGTGTLQLDDLAAECSGAPPRCRVITKQDCDGFEVHDQDGNYRGGVTQVWDLTCAEALQFAQAALPTCSDSFDCKHVGYKCWDIGAEGAGKVPVSCQNGSRRIDITWFIG